MLQGSLCRCLLAPGFSPRQKFCSGSLLVKAHFSAQSVGGRRGGDISSPSLDGGPRPGRGRACYRPVALPRTPAGGAGSGGSWESLPPRSRRRRRGRWTQTEAGHWGRRSAAGTWCPSPQPLGRLLVRSIISFPLPPTDHLEYATSFWCHIALSIGKYKIMKLRDAWVCAKSRTT